MSNWNDRASIEVEVRGDDIGGIAARVADSAEVGVTRTVTDPVVGSDLTFALLGNKNLKGIEQSWKLWRLEGEAIVG